MKDLDVFLGLNCDPITGVGVGSGNACTAVTVCCENNAVVSHSSCDGTQEYSPGSIGRLDLHRLHPCLPLSCTLVMGGMKC